MGLLDEWSRRAMERRGGKVEFLGERSGSVEDTLKRALILEFATRPDIQRAYLANIAFEAENGSGIALCVVSRRPEDRSLVSRVGEIARRQSRDAGLEVVFLTSEQESEVARVCRPFYRVA